MTPETPAAPAPAAPAAPAVPAAGAPAAPAAAPPAAPPPAAPVVPDSYRFTVPDDAKMYLDDTVQTRLATVAKNSGWTQEDLDGEVTNILTERKATHEHLTAELQAHPELGGERQAAAQQDIRRALDFALPPESAERKRYDADLLRLALVNYPPLALAFARFGRAMAEDGRMGGLTPGGAATGDKTDVEVLFPSTPR